MALSRLRIDQAVIAKLVDEKSRVLDLGCGDGLLLEYLFHHKQVQGFGVEISHEGVHACIARGLPVYHGDIDQGLSDHQDDSFDYVILSQTLQAVRRPEFVLREMLRVGKRGIVSFPNFGYWRIRAHLAFRGRMPRTPLLPAKWYNTPNTHLCTILDFQDLCQNNSIRILRQIPLAAEGSQPTGWFHARLSNWLVPPSAANLLAPIAVFLLEKGES
ncbi:MAG: methionine biosynthesis protein MetW [Magnetococcales bacterium]|nr:methionine biosynthesis protein MetW [Magnetococcales bacterium]